MSSGTGAGVDSVEAVSRRGRSAPDASVTRTIVALGVGVSALAALVIGLTVGGRDLAAGRGDRHTTRELLSVAAETLDVVPAKVSLSLGQTIQLTAVIRGGAGPVRPAPRVVWTTSNASIATVSPTGIVTAVSMGLAGITAVAGDARATAAVIVVRPGASVATERPRGAPAMPGPTPGARRWQHEPPGFVLVDDVTWDDVPTPWHSGWQSGSQQLLVTAVAGQADAPWSPGGALQFTFPERFPGGSAPGIVYREANSFGKEVYIAFSWKLSANWHHHPVNDKLLYVVHSDQRTSDSGPNGRMAYVLMLKHDVDPVGLNLMMNEEFYNSNRIQPNRGTRGEQLVRIGAWNTTEIYIRAAARGFSGYLSPYAGNLAAGDPGSRDGVIRIWTNGVLTHEYTDQPTPSRTFLELQLAPVWGGSACLEYDASHRCTRPIRKARRDFLWFDHMHISRGPGPTHG